MAWDLGEINKKQFFELNDMLIVNGINTPHFCNQSNTVTLPCMPGDRLWWVDDDYTVAQDSTGIRGVLVRKDKIYVEDCCGAIDEVNTRYACLTREDAERVRDEMIREKKKLEEDNK